MDPDARRPPGPATRDAPGRGRWRAALRGVVLGWLVLMTVWGFGRSGFPEHERWFLAVGVLAGVVTAVLNGRRATPR